MIIIAKAAKGAEFFYDAMSAHKAPKTSAQAITDALNRIQYDLKPGQVWHVFDVYGDTNAATYASRQAFKRRNGNIIRVH